LSVAWIVMMLPVTLGGALTVSVIGTHVTNGFDSVRTPIPPDTGCEAQVPS